MKESKWYNRVFGSKAEIEHPIFRQRHLEAYELFKKNKFKEEKTPEKPKGTFIK